MRHPFDIFRFGSGFGSRPAPALGASTFHAAQDYGVARGTPVLAIDEGTVTRSYRTVPGGWWTILELDNGDTFGVCHSDQQSDRVGDRVREGDRIVLSGNSGTATTGPHAHCTIKSKGVYVDPRAYIDTATPATSTPATSTPPTPIPQRKETTMILVPVINGPTYFMGNGKNVALSDATIAGQRITGTLSADVLRRRLADPHGLVRVNPQEAEITRYWVALLA